MAKKESEVFPKVVTTAKIKKIVSNQDSSDIQFEDLAFDAAAFAKLACMQLSGEDVEITIEQRQGILPIPGYQTTVHTD